MWNDIGVCVYLKCKVSAEMWVVCNVNAPHRVLCDAMECRRLLCFLWNLKEEKNRKCAVCVLLLSVCVSSVCAKKQKFLNVVFRAKWSERLDICGLEICPITYEKTEYGSTLNGNALWNYSYCCLPPILFFFFFSTHTYRCLFIAKQSDRQRVSPFLLYFFFFLVIFTLLFPFCFCTL